MLAQPYGQQADFSGWPPGSHNQIPGIVTAPMPVASLDLKAGAQTLLSFDIIKHL